MKLCFFGACGHSKTVLAVLPRHPELEVSGICPAYPGDPSVEKLEHDLLALGHHPKRYQTLTDLLESKPELLVVDGVFGEHASAALEAIRRGIPVYGEKPLGITVGECDALSNAILDKPVYLSSMQTARFDPWFYTMKQYIDRGAIGQVRVMNGQKSYKLGTRPDFFKHRASYGGTVSWVGIHMIDLFLWMSGKKLLRSSAFSSNMDNAGHGELESTAVCLLELEQETLATLTIDYLRPGSASTHGDDRLRVVGTGGMIESLHGEVYLLQNGMDTPQRLELLEPPAIFEDFLQGLAGNATLLPPEDAIYSSRVACEVTQALDRMTR